MKKFFALLPMLAVATCSAEQLNTAATIGCDLAQTEAGNYAGSTNPKTQVAVAAIGAVCANPSATVSQVNAARGYLKAAIKG